MPFEGTAPATRTSLAWWVVALAFPLAFCVGALGFGLDSFFALLMSVLGLSTVYMLAMRALQQPGMRRPIVVDARGLFVEGKHVMRRGAIVRASSVPRSDGLSAVHLQGRYPWSTCVVFVDSAEESHALVDALELDTKTQHFMARPPWAKHGDRLGIVLMMIALALMGGWMRAPMFLPAALAGLSLLLWLFPQRVDVGQDGIFLGWLGNKHFIPFGNIETVTRTARGVELAIKGGKRHAIVLTSDDGSNHGRANTIALLDQIRAGIDSQKGIPRAEAEASLTRGGRDIETWVHAMRRLGGRKGGGYRDMAIARERLWDIVENPSADPSAREGAALALGSELNDDEGSRLAALAERTASPRLRLALDGVSREHQNARPRVALEADESATAIESDDVPAAAERGRR